MEGEAAGGGAWPWLGGGGGCLPPPGTARACCDCGCWALPARWLRACCTMQWMSERVRDQRAEGEWSAGAEWLAAAAAAATASSEVVAQEKNSS